MARILTLFFFTFCAFPAVAIAQDSEIFPADRLEALREEIVFEAPVAREETAGAPVGSSAPDLSDLPMPVLVGIGGMLLGALGLLVYALLKGWRRSAGNKSVNQPELFHDEIDEETLVKHGVDPNLLAQAEKTGQFDLAIRLHYLHTLQILNEGGQIRYRKDFSNRDYLQQLREHPIRDDFDQVTRDYERYWYGQYPLDTLSYRLVRSRFDRITEQVAGPAKMTRA
ncbi:DUF4129 domain-containing protein [Lewinella sp. IMCC34191]|uniref:DUF4129 domain-containing protein n=1 Tax=Lewinella sp. IMCC34191 TaxID=2259172 RepID=UPI000E2246D9|nr:DUF4129 domain-containing protein [Lewinella sp. IMCC34191]